MSEIKDSYDVERRRVQNEQALSMEDARMISANGSGVEMLPVDMKEDIETLEGRGPRSKINLMASKNVRNKITASLELYGQDPMNMDFMSEEDRMIAELDRKRARA